MLDRMTKKDLRETKDFGWHVFTVSFGLANLLPDDMNASDTTQQAQDGIGMRTWSQDAFSFVVIATFPKMYRISRTKMR